MEIKQTSADSYHKIGTSHHLCEDYSAFLSGNKHFAIIADGCSSADCSDVGASILSHSLKNILNNSEIESAEVALFLAVNNAHLTAKMLSLPTESLFATLGFVQTAKDGFQAVLSGDGLIFALGPEEVEFIKIEYISDIPKFSNAPFYPFYHLNKDILDSYLECYSKDLKCVIHHYTGNHQRFANYAYSHNENDRCIVRKLNIQSISGVFQYNFPYDKYHCVGVMSDGVDSFYDVQHKPVTFQEVAHEMTSFKNYQGQFVRRRCQKAFKKMSKLGWEHSDDFSIGAISCH